MYIIYLRHISQPDREEVEMNHDKEENENHKHKWEWSWSDQMNEIEHYLWNWEHEIYN